MRLAADGGRLRVNAPRGGLSAALRAQIGAQKEAILALLNRGKAAGSGGTPSIPRFTDDRPAPLSFAQERLWFQEQLAPVSSVFNLCRATRIFGPLDLSSLRSSLNELVRRHEALRTEFRAIDGRPFQCIRPFKKIALRPIDLRSHEKAARELEAARLIQMAARAKFEIDTGRLLRVRLLRMGHNEHILALATHHLVADAWSMGILTSELWSLYESFRGGRRRRLARPSCRYRDYAAWQRSRLRAHEIESDLDYWRERLANAPLLDLPAARRRPSAPSFAGARVEFSLNAPLSASLNELSRREGATLFMTLLAAFQVLLSRCAGQDDVVVGAPAADRATRDLEGVVGLFVNTLVLRVDLSGDPSFRQALLRVREACLGAYGHQAAPFELLVQKLAPRRELNRQPLFQVMFVLQNTPPRPVRPAGLILQPFDVEGGAAQFDLSLYLRERRGRLIGFFEYATELFDRATIESMARQFQILLKCLVADPDRSIVSLPLLTQAERTRLLAEWNHTAAPFPRDASIHELFEAQAARTPGRIALEFADQKLTYGELNGRANRFARELDKLGVGPERLVGVMAERSIETVIALMAILKAGGAYVPLDPAYPDERLRFMLADSGAAVLLSQEKYSSRVMDFRGPRLAVDRLLHGPCRDPGNLKKQLSAENAALMIYTSGSTGMPKGVVAPHRGALNRFSWMWRRYPFARGEKLCLKTSLGFIDSVWEIFGALLRGVPTAIVPDAAVQDPALLVDYLAEHEVTRLVAVPSLLKEIIEACRGAPDRLGALRYCFSSGETLPAELAQQVRERLPDCRLINLYGSSEVAGDVTCYEIDGEHVPPAVPIGRPIDNTQIYILDERMEPVPVGGRGEIYVGGENLARGYHERPELTAGRFIADPFGPKSGARLFRTGDLARYRTDGNIEFLGRIDDQVKIRGCRVELGEVDFALRQHPQVKDCWVVEYAESRNRTDRRRSATENQKLAPSLVAYVVPREAQPAPGELRAFLAGRLPNFMLPGNFICLSALPQLPNGKVDRRALPLPTVAGDTAAIEAGARTELERLVAQLWETVLPVDRVGTHDNFFELGGHSLLAAEVAARLRATLGRPVAVRDLFEAPTVAGLAAKLEKTHYIGRESELPPIRSLAPRHPAPLSLGQERLFLFSQLFGGGDFLNMPYAFRLGGALDRQTLQRAMDEIVRRHNALRTGFRETPDGPRQFIRRRLRLRLSVADLQHLTAPERSRQLERISSEDAALSFDVEEPPLIRVKLVRVGAEQHVLLVTMHHLITDQGSMAVFRSELAALYDAFANDRQSPLSVPAVQFADFACWQRAVLDRGGFAAQVSYWKRQLEGLGPALEFRNGKKGRAPRYHNTRLPIDFDGELFARIKVFARQRSCTPFMVFIAGLSALLHRFTGREDIRIGTLAANRGLPGTDRMIGYCVNALVLRTRVDGKTTFAELIRSVRECCLAAYAHQELPFEYLESLLERRRKKTAAPLYQVMLNYRNQSTPNVEANGLTIASWNGKNRAADPGIEISRLDVNFHLRELPTKLTGVVNYKTDLFDAVAIRRLIINYSAILTMVVGDCERRIGDIALR